MHHQPYQGQLLFIYKSYTILNILNKINKASETSA